MTTLLDRPQEAIEQVPGVHEQNIDGITAGGEKFLGFLGRQPVTGRNALPCPFCQSHDAAEPTIGDSPKHRYTRCAGCGSHYIIEHTHPYPDPDFEPMEWDEKRMKWVPLRITRRTTRSAPQVDWKARALAAEMLLERITATLEREFGISSLPGLGEEVH